MTTIRTITAAAAALLALAGCAESSGGTTGGAAAERTRLEQAVDDCKQLGLSSPYVTVHDEGRSLTVDQEGEDETSGASIDELVCVLAAAGVPDSVVARMEVTRALDGMQTAEWDGITATWTYHPDSGMNLILEEG